MGHFGPKNSDLITLDPLRMFFQFSVIKGAKRYVNKVFAKKYMVVGLNGSFWTQRNSASSKL